MLSHSIEDTCSKRTHFHSNKYDIYHRMQHCIIIVTSECNKMNNTRESFICTYIDLKICAFGWKGIDIDAKWQTKSSCNPMFIYSIPTHRSMLFSFMVCVVHAPRSFFKWKVWIVKFCTKVLHKQLLRMSALFLVFNGFIHTFRYTHMSDWKLPNNNVILKHLRMAKIVKYNRLRTTSSMQICCVISSSFLYYSISFRRHGKYADLPACWQI